MTHDLIRRLEKLGNPRVWSWATWFSTVTSGVSPSGSARKLPVPLLRADQREHRLGGAASVATMLRALGRGGTADRRSRTRRRGRARAADAGRAGDRRPVGRAA